MLKRSCTILTILLAFLWSFSVMAQETRVNDVYEGQFIKQHIPQGQSIPLEYNGEGVTLWDNGPLVTHPAGGFGGADASALQTALTLTVYGFGHQISANNSVADDFTISGSAWNIDEIHFFAYQTGSTTTSTINDVRLQIWNGDPTSGGTVIWGDLTTNVLSGTGWTNIYRVLDTDLLASNRPIMENVVSFTPALNLGPGTYWLHWQTGGTLSSGPWAPPVTILGSTGAPGANAYQNLSGTWQAVLDGTFPQDFPFLVIGSSGPPCPVDPPTNPSPPDGATNVSINPGNATWTNGAGTTMNEVYFGELGNLQLVYDGSAITSLAIPGPLNYATAYGWQVICKNDTCGSAGPVWTFTTEQNPNLVIDTTYVYPQSAAYWTGTTNGTTKTDTSEVRGFDTEDGWFMFDISGITDAAVITEVTFFGYVNATNWPYWSLTPLPGLNPLTATASELKTAIEANSAQGIAYVWSNESSGYTTGPKEYLCETWTNTDLQAALPQDWFAAGMDSRDNSTTYFLNWDGWAQPNVPYLCVVYEWIIPVELTSFTATANDGNVTLNWATATETNNSGFQVERSTDGEFVDIGFVAGHGTTTEPQYYNFTDSNLDPGTYSYRLKQIDLDGTYEYSDVVEVDVLTPKTFSLTQNYPNPFNPSTRIEFSLAADANVTLKVFDILGQEVTTLVNSNLGAGNHTVDFDASLLNSGVYFYKIEADANNGTNFVDVKKMILTK